VQFGAFLAIIMAVCAGMGLALIVAGRDGFAREVASGPFGVIFAFLVQVSSFF